MKESIENSTNKANPNIDESILKILLKDRTTNKNIIWATNDYIKYGDSYNAENEIKFKQVTGYNNDIIKPRVFKNKDKQNERTRDKAEVFTPSWVCNHQNNLIDEAWFGRSKIFNIESNNTWKTINTKILFDDCKEKSWKDYVLLNRMEITCGEAPYLASRYDMISGEVIPIQNRIGLLDRKLRVIKENTDNEKAWFKWTKKAYQSIYGFEYQGDNLLLARKNLLLTFIENYEDIFKRELEISVIKQIANIISWNIWQMDGITYTIPCCKKKNEEQLMLFKNVPIEENKLIYCNIKDWKKSKDNIIEYRSLVGRK